MRHPDGETAPQRANSEAASQADDQHIRRKYDARHLQYAELPSIKALRVVVADGRSGQTVDRPRAGGEPTEVDLPPTLDVVTAGRALGMGRTKSYALARTGKFPCRLIRAGRSFLVPTAELLRVLGLAPRPPVDADPVYIDEEEER